MPIYIAVPVLLFFSLQVVTHPGEPVAERPVRTKGLVFYSCYTYKYCIKNKVEIKKFFVNLNVEKKNPNLNFCIFETHFAHRNNLYGRVRLRGRGKIVEPGDKRSASWSQHKGPPK